MSAVTTKLWERFGNLNIHIGGSRIDETEDARCDIRVEDEHACLAVELDKYLVPADLRRLARMADRVADFLEPEK